MFTAIEIKLGRKSLSTCLLPRCWLTARGAWSASHALQPPPGPDRQPDTAARCGRQWTNYFYTVLSIIIHRLNRQLYVDVCACSLLLPGHWVLDARSHGASGPLAGFWMRAATAWLAAARTPLPGLWLATALAGHWLGGSGVAAGWMLLAGWLLAGWLAAGGGRRRRNESTSHVPVRLRTTC